VHRAQRNVPALHQANGGVTGGAACLRAGCTLRMTLRRGSSPAIPGIRGRVVLPVHCIPSREMSQPYIKVMLVL